MIIMSCDMNDITGMVREYLVDNVEMDERLANDIVKSVIICGDRVMVEFTGIMNTYAEKVFYAILSVIPGRREDGSSATIVFKSMNLRMYPR